MCIINIADQQEEFYFLFFYMFSSYSFPSDMYNILLVPLKFTHTSSWAILLIHLSLPFFIYSFNQKPGTWNQTTCALL